MALQLPCLVCTRVVGMSPSQQRRRTITCPSCCAERRLIELLDPHALAEQIPQSWARALIEGYGRYQAESGASPDCRRRVMAHAVVLGRLMGAQLLAPGQVSESWLASAVKGNGRILSSFSRFLRREGILAGPTVDDRARQAIAGGVARVPSAFRHGVDEYTAFRLRIHDEQRRRQLARVLALRTIATDVRELCRFADHLEMHHPAVTSWALVTETEVVRYLLDLQVGPNSRNIQRWGLHSFFAFVLGRRRVAHNPVPAEPGREAPLDLEPLTVAEQAALIQRWAGGDDPPGSVVGCLALLHGLSSTDLRGLRLADADLDHGRLAVAGRKAAAVLDAVTRRALEVYLATRPGGSLPGTNPHLIVNDHSRFTGKSVSSRFLSQLMRPYEVTVSALRAACFVTVAQESGPRLLVDGFGLSATQAGRYQRFLTHRAEQVMAQHART